MFDRSVVHQGDTFRRLQTVAVTRLRSSSLHAVAQCSAIVAIHTIWAELDAPQPRQQPRKVSEKDGSY